MLFLSVSSIIFLTYFLLASRLGIRPLHQKLVLAGIFGCAQIILTELVLGLLGWLYLRDLILLNLAVSLAAGLCPSVENTDQDIYAEKAFSPENRVLFILMIFVAFWTAVRIYFLPPRFFDELTYHLTPIYQYIIDHKIFLLPVEFYTHYSFPENAEMLFMWPAIFFHSQQWVHLVQPIAAFWGVAVIYGLARVLEIRPPTALFVSLLYIFTPVVLAQMNCCNIDIITAVFFLSALYCAVMFYKSSQMLYFYAAAISVGLLWGMKYNQAFFILPVLLPLLANKRLLLWRHWLGLVLIILFCGGYWYLRNLMELHSFFYKQELYDHDFQMSPIRQPVLHLLKLWQDAGWGTINGGFGLVFFGLAVPAWFYIFIRSFTYYSGQTKKIIWWLSLPFFMGVFQLLTPNLKMLPICERFSIFIVPLGLLDLGLVLTSFDNLNFFKKTVRSLCFLCVFLNLLPGLTPEHPASLTLEAIKDYQKGKYLTRLHYVQDALYRGDRWFTQAAALLDYLTMDGPGGLSCYMATSYRPLTSSVYGSKLQNRVWNLEGQWQVYPDAFIYDFGPDKSLPLRHFSHEFLPEEVEKNPEYILIMRHENRVLFFIRKDFMGRHQKKKLLAEFCANYLSKDDCPAGIMP